MIRPLGSHVRMEFRVLPVGPLQCNCIVVWQDPKAAIVIDPGDETSRIEALLANEGVTPKLILNTHGHFDHTGAVAPLEERFGAEYRIHKADVPILTMLPAGAKVWGLEVPPPPVPRKFVEPGQVFEVGGVRAEAIHTPGHTPGSTCFRFPQLGLVSTGDTLFQNSIGRSDFPGGDGQQLLRSIHERLLVLPADTKVWPGHGPSSTIAMETEHNQFLQ